jgi:putative transposase
MRELGQCYVQYFNRRYSRTGTLWEGRFRSCLVESARYVLACYRYVEMNPVEAHMATSPIAYPWSSHAENIGARTANMVTPHAEYAALGSTTEVCRAAYRALFSVPQDSRFLDQIRDATHGGYALVGDELKVRLTAEGRKHVERGKPGPRADESGEVDSLTGRLAFGEE